MGYQIHIQSSEIKINALGIRQLDISNQSLAEQAKVLTPAKAIFNLEASMQCKNILITGAKGTGALTMWQSHDPQGDL